MSETDEDKDLLGRTYEYCIAQFAAYEGTKGGEFYTPSSIVKTIVEVLKPFDNCRVYDPCCGSGGMFVQSMKFVKAHHGNQKNISVYGQEYTKTTYKLARMNLAIRGISSDIRLGDTFHNDQHTDLKADYIMANPPFNQSGWRTDNELTSDPRWAGFDTPPTSNANYGWILNILSKLSTDGVAGFILSNGALSADGTELAIRKKLLEQGKVEAIIILPRKLFYSTDISVTLWILNNNKKARVISKNGEERHYRDREKEVLFFDMRQMGVPYEKKFVELSEKDRSLVVETYHKWQQEGWKDTYKDVPEFCYAASFSDVKDKGFSLVPSKYIEFANRDEQIDFDAKMRELQTEMRDLLQQEEESKRELKSLFEKLGYKI